jgi:hypothetical protein
VKIFRTSTISPAVTFIRTAGVELETPSGATVSDRAAQDTWSSWPACRRREKSRYDETLHNVRTPASRQTAPRASFPSQRGTGGCGVWAPRQHGAGPPPEAWRQVTTKLSTASPYGR